MSSLNIVNLKKPEGIAIKTESGNSATKTPKKDPISAFFDRHETTRKIVASLPMIVIFGSVCVENITSHKLLSEMRILSLPGAAMFAMCFLSSFAQNFPSSALNEKKIERLN